MVHQCLCNLYYFTGTRRALPCSSGTTHSWGRPTKCWLTPTSSTSQSETRWGLTGACWLVVDVVVCIVSSFGHALQAQAAVRIRIQSTGLKTVGTVEAWPGVGFVAGYSAHVQTVAPRLDVSTKPATKPAMTYPYITKTGKLFYAMLLRLLARRSTSCVA